MTTPDDIADGIDAVPERLDVLNAATQAEIRRTVHTLRDIANTATAMASALDAAAYAQDRQINIASHDLRSTALQIRDTPTESDN